MTWLMNQEDIDNIIKVVLATDGNIAEVGVYKGDMAEEICKMKGDRHLYLFDTWEGLPEKCQLGDLLLKADIEEIKQRLKKYPNVHFIKGIFPETTNMVDDKKFSVVHLDCDLYNGTKGGLEFFYPRSEYIFIHDYPSYEGVRKAVDEFLKEKNIKGEQTTTIQLCLKK